jgi:hypothetical protein
VPPLGLDKPIDHPLNFAPLTSHRGQKVELLGIDHKKHLLDLNNKKLMDKGVNNLPSPGAGGGRK